MVPGYQALTEKEKQTLRLLLDGYDAKSMAQRLGLSVHTINERLRDSRRKLSVSSSKEAARLLRQAERPAPQILGDAALGDASAAPVGQQAAQPGTPAPPPRRAIWAIGGFTMITLVIALLAAPLAPDTRPAAATAAQAPVENPVTRAARDFLALVDANDWAGSFALTGESFRSVNTVATWQSASETMRAKFGAVQSRTLISDQDVPAPPNGYRMIRFRTDFARQRGATETLAFNREDGQWKLVGIYVE